MRRFLRWAAFGILALIALVFMLDTFGGVLLDGPLGPIPGGAMSGPVAAELPPAWAGLPEVIELEIRPEKPWSLSVWNVVIDGELYVPSAYGESRRWTQVALADPRVRVRANGRIYERRIVRVTDPALRDRIARAVAEKYAVGGEPSGGDTTWFFHLAPR